MESIQFILSVVIWFLCPILVMLILIQGGSGDLSSTFGGGGQLDSSLGVGAQRKMGRVTTMLSVVFLVMVLVLAIPLDKGLAVESDPAETETEAEAEAAGSQQPVGPVMMPGPGDEDIEAAVEELMIEMPETAPESEPEHEGDPDQPEVIEEP